jgi:4-amino-4-deoxy-L-arabinose transferase-like glycosyltransferase
MLLDNRFLRIGLLVGLWLAIHAATLSSPALFDDADTVHAEAVREMVESGDWITLKINNGIRYLEKAPLMYWLSALSVSLFGLTDWAVRLPVAIFTLLLTLLLYRFGARMWTEDTGFYAALVFVSSLGPFAFTRIFLPDVILAFFMTLCFYFYLRIALEPEPHRRFLSILDWRCVGLYSSVALAVLTKGLVGLIFVGMIGLVHMIVSGRWDMLRRLQIVPGALLFLLIAAPWHLAAGFANKGFFWFYFMNEHFLRYLGLRYPKDYDTVPLWLFWTLHLAWLFPWTAFLWGLRRIFPGRVRPDSIEEKATLFLFLWIAVILFFFLFSTTQEYYTFPTLPAFALLLGQVLALLQSRADDEASRHAKVGVTVVGVLGVMIGIGLLALAWMGTVAPSSGDLTATLTVNPEQYALSFGHIHDLTPATFSHLSELVTRTAVIFILGSALALLTAWLRRWRCLAICLALIMTGLLHSYHAGMNAFEPVLSSRGLARTIQYHHRTGDRIVVNGVYERGSSINYYSRLQLSVLNGHFGNLWYGSYFPDCPPIFLDDESFLRIWSSDQRVFLFSEQTPLDTFLSRHPEFPHQVLAKAGGKKVLINW